MAVKTFGYARVSSTDQNLARQLDALKQFGVSECDIFQEKISGVKKDRPAFEALKQQLREGDTVVVESLSRLSRSAKDLLALVEEWDAKGIKFVSLKENIDFSTPTGKLMLGMLSSMVEFERNIMRERADEGRAAARARGMTGGRPKVNQENLKRALRMYDSKLHCVREICEVCQISSSTLYRAINARSVEEIHK